MTTSVPEEPPQELPEELPQEPGAEVDARRPVGRRNTASVSAPAAPPRAPSIGEVVPVAAAPASGSGADPAPGSPVGALAGSLGASLAARGLVFTAAESCTGGLIAAAMTSVAGSSAWFGAGFVTYANDAKTTLLGVDVATLERDGAVSEAVVRAMASGARSRAGADVAVAVSGVAGPGGGSAIKPIGTVWLAWALPDGTVEATRYRFPGGRADVRARAVEEALRGTISRLDRTPPGPY